MARRNIFAPDPDGKPRGGGKYEAPAFTFKSGMLIDGLPASLPEWRVLTGEESIADAIGQLMGGTPEEYDSEKEMNLHVMTSSDSVEIVIDSADDIDAKRIKWGANGPEHVCDGRVFVDSEEDTGQPCGCPPTLREAKEASRRKRNPGPRPYVTVRFRLAEDPELGLGELNATAWDFAEAVYGVQNKLDRIGEPALCVLRLNHVSYYSQRLDKDVSYRHPEIVVKSSYNKAIAQERG
jgi:hypothetical protein